MKKVNTKIAFLGIISLLTFGTIATSCSKDDEQEEPAKGSIDVAVGTYKGKLYTPTYNPGEQSEWFDAIVIVTKEGTNKLKVTPKANETYSFVTPKTFTVETGAFFGSNTQDIVSLSGSLEGFFHFYGSNNNISITTEQQAETDVYFNFEGVKQ